MIFRSALLIVCAGLCCAQSTDRDQRWIQDANWLYQQLTATHPDPFRLNSREKFEEHLESLKAEIPGLPDYAVVARLAKMLAMVGDGHTSLNLMNGSRLAGVQVRWFSDGLWITGGGATTGQLIGKRVVAVNGVATDEVFQRLKAYLSFENESWARNISVSPILSPEVLTVIGVLPSPSSVPVTLEDKRGERTEALLPAGGSISVIGPHLTRPLNPLWRRYGALNYWAEYLEESRTLYIKYNQCGESPALKMADFARELAALAVAKQPTRVIFDLRDNTGGDSSWLGVMLYDLQIAFEEGRLALPSSGLFAITSKTTFSSGTLGAKDLVLAGAVTVGEATGGNATGFGPTVTLTLPNTRINVSCSRGWIQSGDWGPKPVPAEIEVEFPSAAYFADQDPYLEAALKAVRSYAPPGGGANAIRVGRGPLE